MGWKLVAEVLDHCPDISYREFRILVALALDAREETRQGMPGMELLTLRGNCGMRTTQRAMRGLIKAGLVKMVKLPAPGRRAVYENLPLATDDNMLSSATRDSMLSSERTTEPGQRTTKTSPTHDSNSGVVSVNLPSHRSQSSLSRAVEQIQAAVPGATEREIREIVSKIEKDPSVRYAAAYLRAAVANGDAPVLVAEARNSLDKRDAMAPMFAGQGNAAATENANGARPQPVHGDDYWDDRIELAQYREDNGMGGTTVAEVIAQRDQYRADGGQA